MPERKWLLDLAPGDEVAVLRDIHRVVRRTPKFVYLSNGKRYGVDDATLVPAADARRYDGIERIRDAVPSYWPRCDLNHDEVARIVAILDEAKVRREK